MLGARGYPRLNSNAFHVMPCFSTGIPVINEAIVGKLSAGFTAVADQVADPSLKSLLKFGIVPPFTESWLNPSRTRRMTCSVVGAEGVVPGVGEAAMGWIVPEEASTRRIIRAIKRA